MTLYEARGNVRGACGHKHRTIRTAVDCLLRDQRGCRQQGGYSDRVVHRCDGRDLTQDEHWEYWDAMERGAA